VSALVIAGCGLLGSSVARASRQSFPKRKIVGVEPDEAARAGAAALGVFDVVVADLEAVSPHLSAAGSVDCIGVAATPPAQLAAAMLALAPLCGLVMDVGSIKAGVVTELERSGAPPACIVPCHPMAGSHQQGPAAGQAELFRGRWVFVVPMTSSAGAAVQLAHEFWQALGAHTTAIDAHAHDAAVAYTSHLPHLLSSSYMTVDSPVIAAAGTGYMEFTRLAKANPTMWSQVLVANGSALRPLLDGLRESLAEVSELIETGDAPALEAWLGVQKEKRERVQQQLEGSVGGDREA